METHTLVVGTMALVCIVSFVISCGYFLITWNKKCGKTSNKIDGIIIKILWFMVVSTFAVDLLWRLALVVSCA